MVIFWLPVAYFYIDMDQKPQTSPWYYVCVCMYAHVFTYSSAYCVGLRCALAENKHWSHYQQINCVHVSTNPHSINSGPFLTFQHEHSFIDHQMTDDLSKQIQESHWISIYIMQLPVVLRGKTRTGVIYLSPAPLSLFHCHSYGVLFKLCYKEGCESLSNTVGQLRSVTGMLKYPLRAQKQGWSDGPKPLQESLALLVHSLYHSFIQIWFTEQSVLQNLLI